MYLALPTAIACLATAASAATSEEWASKSIYQIITDRFAKPDGSTTDCDDISHYCGGTYAGLVKQLDYIQNMGFTAIQISPVQRNLNTTTIYGQAYHGYWVQDLYSLNDNFGTAADLNTLSSELHKRNMYLMVDVVANEVAYDIGNANMSDTIVIDYSDFIPFNDEKYYNSYCPITDWFNQSQIETCWLGTEGVATPDLRTQDSDVSTVLGSWIKDFVANYSIDGIRIDGAKQTNTAFFKPFVASAGVYAMGEVDDGDANYTCTYQDYTAGLENYPLYYTIIRAFTAGDMLGLVDMIQEVKGNCSSPQYLTTFIENQDNERFASYVSDMVLASNAIAFTLLADGIPKMYYGQEQHLTGNYSPYNRQPLWSSKYDTTSNLYNLTATLNKLRNHAISVDSTYVSNLSTPLYTDNSTYAARKGPNGVQIVQILSNQGAEGGAYELTVPGAADEGTNMTEVFGCTTFTAGKNGSIVVEMGKGAPKVYFPTFQLNGSGICGQEEDSSAGTASSTSTSSSSSSSDTSKSKGHGLDQLRFPISITMGFILLISFAMFV